MCVQPVVNQFATMKLEHLQKHALADSSSFNIQLILQCWKWKYVQEIVYHVIVSYRSY